MLSQKSLEAAGVKLPTRGAGEESTCVHPGEARPSAQLEQSLQHQPLQENPADCGRFNTNALKGIRIPVPGLKGRCPGPLDDGGMRVKYSRELAR